MLLPKTLILGTGNRKKGEELAALFEPTGLQIRTLADVANPIEVVEDGDSFAANAAKKATQQAVHLGAWVLAEDSGLTVDALAGAPGVYSARFAGPSATDAENNALLLQRLATTPPERRAAAYICHMTLADAKGEIRAETTGHCRGRIVERPRGEYGFGYDPLFEIIEYHRTVAELGPLVKARISHRGRAARRMLAELTRLVAASE